MPNKELIQAEKDNWEQVESSLDFMLELATTKADREMVQDASNRLSEKLTTHLPLFKERCAIELNKRKT